MTNAATIVGTIQARDPEAYAAGMVTALNAYYFEKARGSLDHFEAMGLSFLEANLEAATQSPLRDLWIAVSAMAVRDQTGPTE